MHVIFIPYGNRNCVETLLRVMEAQNHKLRLKKKGEKDMDLWIKGGVRILPMGAMEYVFPKEDLDCVLKTLKFDVDDGDRYGLGNLKLAVLRKMFKAKKIPKFKTDKHYLWFDDEVTMNVNIVPIGIREDGEITDDKGKPYEGWTHEAL